MTDNLYLHEESGEIRSQEGWEIFIEKEKEELLIRNHAREMARIDYWIKWDMNFDDYVNAEYLILIKNKGARK